MSSNVLESIRRHAAVAAAALALGMVYGSLAAIAAKVSLGIEETTALLFVGLPICVVLALSTWRKFPKILGFEK